MRKALFVAPALLAACANSTPSGTGGPPTPTPIHGVTPGHKCRTAGTDKFIGQLGISRTGSAIKRASRAAVLRWAPPGYMLTMDYREDRVTVYLDADRKITKINCG
jgi:Peptidase inhibitor I78 family